MGLESLYLFTLLGGLAAGTYAFETGLRRTREGERPWLVPLIVVIVFLVGLIAAATHVNVGRAMSVAFGGTINFGSGMIREVAVSALFFVLALIDLIVTFATKKSPYGLRIVTAIVGVICIVLMGAAYIDVYGVAIWTNVPATILSFVGGDLAMGLALYALLANVGYDDNASRVSSIVVNVVLAIGLALEIMAFTSAGADPLTQIIGLVVAPIASIVLVAAGSKFNNKRTLAIIVCVLAIVGVAVSRYAFYATCTML